MPEGFPRHLDQLHRFFDRCLLTTDPSEPEARLQALNPDGCLCQPMAPICIGREAKLFEGPPCGP